MLNRLLSMVLLALLAAPAWATPIASFPASLSGDLSSYDLMSTSRGSGFYADHYEVNVVPGQQLTIDVNTTSGGYDGYLALLDSSGSVLASNDDYGDTRHSHLVYTAMASGTLTIEVTSYGSGVYSGNGTYAYTAYELSVSSLGGGSSVTQTLTIPSSATDSLASTDSPSRRIIGAYADNYSIYLNSGDTVTIDHQSTAFDAYLSIFDPNGNWLVSNDDSPSGGTLNSQITYTATMAGTYGVEATSLSAGRTGAYTISTSQASSTSTLYSSFYAYPTSGMAPLYVSFSNSSYSSNYNDQLSYFWDFGNGASSTTASPSYTYSVGGTFTATLTVRNQAGQQATYSQVITVQQPQVTVTANFSVGTALPQTNLPVAFYNGSYSSQGQIASYTWDFGDGQYSTLANPTHIYTVAGTYTVRLTVMDSMGQVGNYSQNVTVQPSAASFTASFRASSTSPRTNEPVTFVNQTTGPAGSSFTYQWSFGDGSTGYDLSPTHTYTQAGMYMVTLTATNQMGQSATFNLPVTVTAGASVVSNFTYAISSTSSLQVAFTNTSTSSLPTDVLTYSWDFGDGQTSTDRSPTHTYTAAGTYTVILNTMNSSGQTAASPAQTVTVTSTSSGNINVTGIVRLMPQVLMGGFDPILIDVADTSFKLVAIVRPGATPIQSVQFRTGSGGFAQSMMYSGTYSNGDQRYESSMVFPRGSFPQNAVMGDLFGGTDTQFRISVVDNAQQEHYFPRVAFGNTPVLTMAITSPNNQVSTTAGTLRLAPQVLMAGFDPMLVDLADTSFDVVAIVRAGVVPIQSVTMSQNQGGFSQAMNLTDTLPNGDKKYKMTLTFPRGAFDSLQNDRVDWLFGTAASQFNIVVTDQAQQTHRFPEFRFGNWPALTTP